MPVYAISEIYYAPGQHRAAKNVAFEARNKSHALFRYGTSQKKLFEMCRDGTMSIQEPEGWRTHYDAEELTICAMEAA